MRSLVLPLLLFAQTVGQLPPVIEQVEVHVVNVDVCVTDASGKPVLDLTKDDFEILEDGRPQTITNFAVMTGRTGFSRSQSPAEPPAPSADNRRRILLIIDNNYLAVIERNRALDEVQKYLDGSHSGDWAVAVIGHGVDMLQSFTADQSMIATALKKARAMPTSEAQNDIDRAVLSERFNRKTDVTVPEDYRAKLAFMSREQTYRNLMTVQNTARAVVDTARSYAAEPGNKYIVLLTGGMETNTSFAAYEKKNDPELRELRDQIAQISDAMVREANGANFTVHVINARTRGMMAPQHDVENHSSGTTSLNLLRNFPTDPIDVSDVDSLPLSIALGTGGMYLPSNDLRGSLQRIDTITSNFYSLGYSPDHNGDRRYHTISVRVKRNGVRVANRTGYFDETPEDRLEEMLRLRMKFDEGFGSLPVQVEIGKAAPAADHLIVPVTAEMPLSRMTILPYEQNFIGRVHVYCSVFDADGRNISFLHKTQKIILEPQQLERLGTFRYTMNVHLEKGAAFTIVMTLRDELSNEIGSASQSIHL